MSREKNTTREKILRSTWKLLEHGEAGQVRMSDIAKAASVSRQAVYLHFPNRAELLTETTRFIDQENDVDALLAKSRNVSSGEARLVAWIEAWGNYIPIIHGVARALIDMQSQDAEARAAWKDRLNAIHEGCMAAAQALDKDGCLTSDMTTDDAADFLWALLSIENWEKLTLERGWTQERYILHITACARRALIG